MTQGHAAVGMQGEHILLAAAAGNQGHLPNRHELCSSCRG